PIKGDKVATTDEMFESSIRNALNAGYIHKGDTVVLSAGVPVAEAGTTNLIRVYQV
ncbi:pyruvate kinase, partial [Paenibacillus sp. EKM208P]